MAGAGDLQWLRFATAGAPIVMPAGGPGPIAVGIGILITPGAGHRFITGAGATILAMVGSGVPTGYGRRRGSVGVSQVRTAAGLPYPRVPVFPPTLDGPSKGRR